MNGRVHLESLEECYETNLKERASGGMSWAQVTEIIAQCWALVNMGINFLDKLRDYYFK
jgi:hypothetical protein